jgi:TonB family protein
MTAAVANPDDYGLGKFFVYSIILHVLVAAAIAASVIFHLTGQGWGDVGNGTEGAVKVRLAVNGNIAGLPMPTPPVLDDAKTFDPTESLYKETPQPKPPEPPKEIIKIPTKEKPKPIEKKSRIIENKNPAPDNTTNQHNGQLSVPRSYTEATNNPNGVQIQSQGGGDFAGRYPAYVAAMLRRISQNWNQSTIDPNARASPSIRATATFTIMRDGTLKDIRIIQSSRNSSFDNSGLRALYDSNPMPALPSDYNGSYLTVTFDFLPPGTQPVH